MLSEHDGVEKQTKTGHSDQEAGTFKELLEVLKVFGMTRKINRADWEVLTEEGQQE